jgi:hypothetical protein
MYFSGAWRGYWEQQGLGRQKMHNLVLHFDGQRVHGRGTDCIGVFVFDGEVTEGGGIAMVKRYLGAHAVLYAGQYDGEGVIFGRWSVPGIDSGNFALRPLLDSSLKDAPIRQWRA